MSYDAVNKREALYVFGNSKHDGFDVIIDYRAVSEFWFKKTSRFASWYVIEIENWKLVCLVISEYVIYVGQRGV